MGSGAVQVPMSQQKSALKLDKAVVASVHPAAITNKDENRARVASDACVAAVTATAVTATAAMLQQAPTAADALKPQPKALCLSSMRRCLVDMEGSRTGVSQALGSVLKGSFQPTKLLGSEMGSSQQRALLTQTTGCCCCCYSSSSAAQHSALSSLGAATGVVLSLRSAHASGPTKSPHCGQGRQRELRALCMVCSLQYAVRGVIVDKAEDLRKQLLCNPQDFPNIPEIVPANIGNPQAVGQKPLTFNRQERPKTDRQWQCAKNGYSRRRFGYYAVDACLQVIACMICPSLRPERVGCNGDESSVGAFSMFPDDVIERASRYATGVPAIGAYSHSQGALIFRQEVAKWFEARDGHPCDPQTVFLTDGASAGIRLCLETLIGSPNDGILIPIPQYPLYKATITRLDGQAIPYYLDEDKGWALTATELKRAVDAARKNGIVARALAVINPGNPTGSLLSRAEIEEIVRFCERERLVILADEVYQDNVYGENAKFVSFRQVTKDLNSYAEVISFHSSSKGLGGECGFRGGLMQLENIDAEAVGILYKLSSVSLCSNLVGQAMMASIVNPPKKGDASYETDSAERHAIFTSLQRKARYVSDALNSMPGVKCQPIEGAMYAFPRITLPPRAIEAAKEQQMAPDMLYCMKMLNETGVICVPGSGFEQYPGTYHYRLTILPEEAKFPGMLERIRAFHLRFMEHYA